jgi:LPS-assembly protein
LTDTGTNIRGQAEVDALLFPTVKIVNSITAKPRRSPLRLTSLLIGLVLPLHLSAQDNNQLDWSPIKSVPEKLQDKQCQVCEGRYKDPLADADLTIPLEQQNIEASATSTELRDGEVTLTGGVILKQGYRTLTGNEATVNRLTESGTLEGDITLREPGVLLRGGSAVFSADSGEATVTDSQFVLHKQHIRGEATKLYRDPQGVIAVEDGSLSYCAPDNDDWILRADSIELNLDEGVGTARGARIEVSGIPLIYTPWLSFPLDDRRKSGFLWPEIGNDSSGGLDISAPLYLNLAPNYDVLYTPRYIQERGLNHELAFRYLGEHTGLWTLGGSYLNDDKRYEDEFPEERNHDRWLTLVKHNGLFQQRWRSKVDFGKASDANYFKDLDSSSLDVKRQTSLRQLGSVDYLGDDWLVEFEVQEFQSLADDINNDYKTLPQITSRYRGLDSLWGLKPILLAQYSNFDTDLDRVTGERIYAEAGIEYPMLWTHGFLKSTVKYRALDYKLTPGLTTLDDESPSAGSALASIDGGLTFERPIELANIGLIQTLEPRAYYLYSEHEDQQNQPDFDSAELTFSYNQLFRETRFSGHDRLDDANQLAVGVTTRFIGNEDGHQYLSASIGQIFYFEDREVQLNFNNATDDKSGSEMAAEITYSPNERLDLRSSIVWDPFSGNVNSGSLQTAYSSDNGALYNIGYTFRRPKSLIVSPITEQATLSTYLPLDANWSVFASWSYSLEAETTIEDMFGLEYDSCCWKVRLLHLRYFDNIPGENIDFTDPNLEREQSTEIQFILKGMGGFGSSVSNVLVEMIRGFEESEY